MHFQVKFLASSAACQEVPYVTMEELEQVAPQRKKAKMNGKIWEVSAKHSPSRQELDATVS